jgi:hypothetical protein
VIMKWRENQNQVSIGVVNQMIYQWDFADLK